jgi:hypothetical protein
MIPTELPNFQATWWPLRMETIPGSGEAITVATIVRAASGQAQVRQSIAPAVLTGLFGQAGRGVASMVGSTVLDIQEQLNSGCSVESLDMPFGGFFLGSLRDCVARDINEVFDVAVKFSAAFGQSNYGVRREAADPSKRAFEDWADKIRADLLSLELKRITLMAQPEEFNVRIKLSNKAVKIGFLRGSYAVNFGVMRPRATSGDTRSLKVKVFDLEAVRRDQQIHQIQKAEVLVGCPPVKDLGYLPDRERETFLNSMDFIEREAKARDVTLVRFSAHADAARHIAQLLAA